MGAFLLAVFIFWSYNAFEKFIDQPVSTQIEFKFGDDGLGNISFPVITFCNNNFSIMDAKLG